ncbi:MAG: hypothetical protein IPM81_22295 [Saprospirales bacterium]|nr:hypothetical protein [Saprospirales bacterium]
MKPVTFLLLFLPTLLFSQKKAIEIADVHRWRKIEQTQITPGGEWVAYLLTPTTQGDNTLCLWNAQTGQTSVFARAAESKFSYDGQYLVFKIKPPLDTLKTQRRRKVKDEDLPKDSLGIYDLKAGQLTKLPGVRSYALPEKWSGWVAYQLEPEKPEKTQKDEKAAAEKPLPDSTKTAGPEAKKKPAKPQKRR